MSMRVEIIEQHPSWSRPLTISACLHAGLIGSILLFGWFLGRATNVWGLGGPEQNQNVVQAQLVASAVPLPSKTVDEEGVLATESTGKSVSEPKPPEKAPEAIPLPGRPD